MPIRKVMKSVPVEHLAAEGLFDHDKEALTTCQRECTSRLAMTIQLEQESYMTKHPELIAAMELFICQMIRQKKKKLDVFKEAGNFFLRPLEHVDQDIRQRLNIGPDVPYLSDESKKFLFHDDENLINDLMAIISKHFPPPPWSDQASTISHINTQSSSFISLNTSDTTLPTPEPIATPEPTLSENMFNLISNTVDKAIFLKVDDQCLRYDTAYVELSKAVEAAMDIPVADIRDDIIDLFMNAYTAFEINIQGKEKIAAEIAWDKRIRKKMKRTLRRYENFKGYESPPSSKSSVSSHESYSHPPPRPCKCHPQWTYNRYAKDRFGIYLPVAEYEYDGGNVTLTPIMSWEKLPEREDSSEGKSVSRKSIIGAIQEPLLNATIANFIIGKFP